MYGANILDAIPDMEYGAVIDAVFGIGVNREIQGNYYKIIQQMNQLRAWKVAVDIPSGIHTDTGEVMGIAFQADMTVTFAFEKIGIMAGASTPKESIDEIIKKLEVNTYA